MESSVRVSACVCKIGHHYYSLHHPPNALSIGQKRTPRTRKQKSVEEKIVRGHSGDLHTPRGCHYPHHGMHVTCVLLCAHPYSIYFPKSLQT